jgi:hypothetical protein
MRKVFILLMVGLLAACTNPFGGKKSGEADEWPTELFESEMVPINVDSMNKNDARKISGKTL